MRSWDHDDSSRSSDYGKQQVITMSTYRFYEYCMYCLASTWYQNRQIPSQRHEGLGLSHHSAPSLLPNPFMLRIRARRKVLRGYVACPLVNFGKKLLAQAFN